MPPFELDPRLARDTISVCDLSLCAVRLMTDRRFPWAVLIPQRAGLVELHDLSAAEQATLIEEAAQVSSALKSLTHADKINIGALGNIVRQLHIHVVARFENDTAWPGPIWGSGPPETYPPGEADALSSRLAAALAP